MPLFLQFSSSNSRVTRRLGKLVLVGLFCILGGFAAAYLLLGDRFRNWAQTQIISTYIREVGSQIPFQIEKIYFDADFDFILEGGVSRLEIVVSDQYFRYTLDGAIEAWRVPSETVASTPENNSYEARYDPKVTIAALDSGQTSDPLYLELAVLLSSDFKRFQKIELHALSPTWRWEALGIAVDAFELSATAENGHGQFTLKSGEADLFLGKSRELYAGFGGLKAKGEIPFELLPFRLGPKGEWSWAFEDAAIQTLEDDFHLPLSKLSGQGEIEMDREGKPTRLKAKAKNGGSVRVDFNEDHQKGIIRSGSQPLVEVMKSLFEFLGVSPPQGVRVTKGVLDLLATFYIPKGKDPVIKTELQLRNLGAVVEKAELKVEGLNLRLPLRVGGVSQGEISARKIQFKKLKGSLSPQRVESVQYRDGLRIEIEKGLNPEFQSYAGGARKKEHPRVPLSLGKTFFEVQNGKPLFHTSVRMPPTSYSVLKEAFCVDATSLPGVQMRLDFPKLEIGEGGVLAAGVAGVGILGEMIDTVIKIYSAAGITVVETSDPGSQGGSKKEEKGILDGITLPLEKLGLPVVVKSSGTSALVQALLWKLGVFDQLGESSKKPDKKCSL